MAEKSGFTNTVSEGAPRSACLSLLPSHESEEGSVLLVSYTQVRNSFRQSWQALCGESNRGGTVHSLLSMLTKNRFSNSD